MSVPPRIALLLGIALGATASAAETVCTADLLCVSVERPAPAGGGAPRVTLALENLTHKPLSFRLLLAAELAAQAPNEVLYLSRPQRRTLATFARPTGPWGFEYRVHYGHHRHTHCDDCVYILPYAPGRGYVVSQSHANITTHRLGNRYALDWAMPEGEAVHAARGGRVVSTYAASNTQSASGAATANHIWVQHDDGTIGKYLHMAFQGVAVAEGEQVLPGQYIGASGNTGFTHGPHLHFSVSTLGGEALYETFNVRFETQFGVQSLVGGQRYVRPQPGAGRAEN